MVAFDPAAATILPLVSSIAQEVEYVFVFVNTVIDDAILAELQQFAPYCQIIKSDYNLGVAEALNIIALHALVHGCGRVVIFDQDSRPPRGMISALSRSADRLIENGTQVAVIGPKITDPQGRSHEFKSPRYFQRQAIEEKDGTIPVHYLITSSSLIDLRVFRAIG
ncbi:hypothetical protein DC522_26915 [Microvirga sp. KLBC 81]|nr:hypothetical protein DC522_26915 [Microvirga sp. KLBC 81]